MADEGTLLDCGEGGVGKQSKRKPRGMVTKEEGVMLYSLSICSFERNSRQETAVYFKNTLQKYFVVELQNEKIKGCKEREKCCQLLGEKGQRFLIYFMYFSIFLSVKSTECFFFFGV